MRTHHNVAGESKTYLPHHRPKKNLTAATCGFHDYVVDQGADPREILHDVGIDESQLDYSRTTLDLASYVKMMELASYYTGNENFGLGFGQQLRPEMCGLIGEVAIVSTSLEAALINLATLFPYHQQATEIRLNRNGEFLRLEYRILDGSVVERRQDAELTMGLFTNIFRHCLRGRWAPEEVHFEHLKPQSWRKHESAFDAAVYFGQRTNALVFRDGALSTRMPRADLHRLGLLHAELTQVKGGTGDIVLRDKVKGEIRSMLALETPRIQAVAEAIGLTRWTLQRRLEEQGANFDALVNAVRRELAVIYIRQAHITMTEIAFALGYSELSAFTRAFQRWFGASPKQVRMSL